MKIITLVSALVLFLVGNIAAQSRRDPNPAEKAVLDKAVNIIENTLNQFNNNDWGKEQDYYDGDILIAQAYNSPLQINTNFERHYRVLLNSDRYNNLLKPIEDKVNDAMQKGDYKRVQELGDQSKALSSLTVDVYVNYFVAGIFPGKPGNVKLDVKGPFLSYKTNQDQYSNKDIHGYWLLYGNWPTVQNGPYGLTFKFKRPPSSPYIENIAIIITGAEDRIQELLKTADWTQLQAALTP
jgi:hypothetical protein